MDKYLGMLLDNRYEILDVIGTGGMAVVYYARCRLLNRYVAIKILKDEFANDVDFRRRFHTEAQAVAKLQHPNIVSVFDVNRTDNIEYIVMELVDGITLKEYMEKRGALSAQEFMHFAPQIAHALEHAHSRGIIHRDIKPQNMIILNDGSLKVTDFGIARIAQQQQSTATDEALGSVHYVSPEQARGSQIDARSDIYSFGVMMYEMLTGKLPFDGDTPVAVVLQHFNSIPQMPREIDPEIPAALEQIVMHAMATEMDDRYSSAAEIIRDFERYQKNPNVVFPYALPTQKKSDEPTVPVTKAEEKRGFVAGILNKLKLGGKGAEEDLEPYEAPRRTSVFVYIITAILTAAIFLGGAAFIITTIFGTSVEAEEMSAPYLVGLKLDEVLSSAEYGSKYNIVEGDSVYNSDVEEGVIIAQNPAYGRTIRSDTEINVTVSLGAKKIPVPNLVDAEYRVAQLKLDEIELMYTSVYEVSDTVKEGNIIRTIPEANTEVTSEEPVQLVISLGKNSRTTTAPNLLGYTAEEAKAELEAKGLLLGKTIPVESKEEAGRVINQSVAADSDVPENTEVDIYIAAPRSASIQENSPETTTAPAEPLGTCILTLRLPTDRGDKIKVSVKAGSELLWEQECETAKGMINVTLNGNGSELVQVYFNDSFVMDQVVIFD